MVKFGGIHSDQLRQLIERVEKLEEEKQQAAENVRDLYSEAKAHGFDPKIMRQVVRLRKMDVSDREEQETILDTYKAALGMIPDFEPRGESTEATEEAA